MTKAIFAVLVAAFVSKAAVAQIPPIASYTPVAPFSVTMTHKEYHDPNGAFYCSVEQSVKSFQIVRFSAPDQMLVNTTTIKSCLSKLPKQFKKETIQNLPVVSRDSGPVHHGPLNCQIIKPAFTPSRYELRFAVMATVKDEMIRECFSRIGSDLSDSPNNPSNWEKST